MMVFRDYIFEIDEHGMALDPLLKLAATGWNQGDFLEVSVVNDRVVLVRKTALTVVEELSGQS